MATKRLIRYVILDVHRVDGGLTIEYSDSEGRATPVFTAAIDALRELTSQLTEQIGPYHTGVSPLAVFVRGESIDGETLEAVARELEPFIDLDHIQLIALPYRDWTPRAFTLPLEVAFTSRRMSRSLASLPRETPRLCRGGSRSLTCKGVHRGNS